VQAFTLGVIIVWNVVATFVILKLIGLFVSLRMSKAELEGADEVVHGEYVIDVEGLAIPEYEGTPVLAGVAVDGDRTGGPVAAQLRVTLGEALGVHPDSLALLSGEQAANALARHAALEARLGQQGSPGGTSTVAGKAQNRTAKTRPAAGPDEE
jgi:hypothetical protein